MNSTLTERKKQEQEKEAQIVRALTCRKKLLAEVKRENRRKRKSVEELLALLTLKGMTAHTLRPAEAYVPRSHNLDRQLTGLIDHLFVQYPVPGFLYQVCLADKTAAPKNPQKAALNDAARAQLAYRQWFVTLAQGGSFPKAVKGVMTSREASFFLRAPEGRKVHENIWWARMIVAGVPEKLIGELIDRVFTNHLPGDSDGRLGEAILFYARHFLCPALTQPDQKHAG